MHLSKGTLKQSGTLSNSFKASFSDERASLYVRLDLPVYWHDQFWELYRNTFAIYSLINALRKHPNKTLII
jgi:hypothetical protein